MMDTPDGVKAVFGVLVGTFQNAHKTCAQPPSYKKDHENQRLASDRWHRNRLLLTHAVDTMYFQEYTEWRLLLSRKNATATPTRRNTMQRRAALWLAAVWAGSAAAQGSAYARAGVDPSTSNAAVIKMPLTKGLSAHDCVQSMQLRANLLNMKQVGDLPLSEQVQAMTGKPQRLVRVFLFCDPLTAIDMVDGGGIDFAAYLPCRITLVEDDAGKLWLVMMNLQPLIASVPPGPLREKAEKVGATLMQIMKAGAEGSL
jgi:uncharacterized protein (DUF302 family)